MRVRYTSGWAMNTTPSVALFNVIPNSIAKESCASLATQTQAGAVLYCSSTTSTCCIRWHKKEPDNNATEKVELQCK